MIKAELCLDGNALANYWRRSRIAPKRRNWLGRPHQKRFVRTHPEASAPGQLEAANLWPLSAEIPHRNRARTRELCRTLGARRGPALGQRQRISIDEPLPKLWRGYTSSNSADQGFSSRGIKDAVRADTARHAQPA